MFCEIDVGKEVLSVVGLKDEFVGIAVDDAPSVDDTVDVVDDVIKSVEKVVFLVVAEVSSPNDVGEIDDDVAKTVENVTFLFVELEVGSSVGSDEEPIATCCDVVELCVVVVEVMVD